MKKKKVGSYLQRPQRLVTDASRALSHGRPGEHRLAQGSPQLRCHSREAAWLSAGVPHEANVMQTPAQVPVLVMPPESNLQHRVRLRASGLRHEPLPQVGVGA